MLSPLSLLLPLLLGGCGALGLLCDQVHYSDRLFVDFTLTVPGSYEIFVIADEETVGCTGALPPDGTERCDGAGDADFRGPHPPEVEYGAIYGVDIDTDAASIVHLRIVRDGVVLVDDSAAPEWSESSPNGKGCGVVASGLVTFDVE